MTRKEIKQHSVGLAEILRQTDAKQKWEQALDLALEVGASVWPSKVSDVGEIPREPGASKLKHDMWLRDEREAATAEIARNIHIALQTATMIDMCRTANRNVWVALIASVVAFLSMIAAWLAAMR
jgi:hypothetical protein